LVINLPLIVIVPQMADYFKNKFGARRRREMRGER
jgi:hypothetical protein